jgi:hypothetical protein
MHASDANEIWQVNDCSLQVYIALQEFARCQDGQEKDSTPFCAGYHSETSEAESYR